MMMDTAVTQQTDSNGQTPVTATERHALVQRLAARWPMELSKQVENQAYEKSHGIKPDYFKLIQAYFQKVQLAFHNRASQQQQQQQNNNVQFQNAQPTSVPVVNKVQHPLNQMPNQPPRFPVVQQPSRMPNPQITAINEMARLHEPQKFNQTSTTTIDLSQGYSSRQINPNHHNDYSTNQPRYPIQSTMNVPRQRTIMPNNNFPSQSLSNNTSDILHQIVVGNSSSLPTTTGNTNNSANGDQLLHRILLSNNDGGVNKLPTQTRQTTATIMPRSASTMSSNMTNSINPLRTSLSSQQLSSSPSVVIIPTPTQTSTVQIQPLSNITIQQSPLNNSNGSFSVNSQTVSANSSTPLLANYSSPINRALPLAGSSSILSPDDETLNLIKYLKENINRLQLLSQKFTNEGNTEKVRQVQSIHQQILQFITNPSYEGLAHAKHFRDMLERIPNRLQQNSSTTSQTNVFNQCSKAMNEFLSRDYKERINVTKRYLEPLSDVINGVPHKMMRLDFDNYSTTKTRSINQSSLLSDLNDEINQLSNDIYSIECVPVSRTRKIDNDDEYLCKNGVILRCKLLEKSNPIIPKLRLYVTTLYPQEPPEVLSLTKTMPPRLEFTDGHPFFDQISSIFVSHLFKLRPQHTITDILNIWRLSVQTAL